MHLQHIRAFVTIANLGHLTKAAESLHLTQPALSAQLKGLEDRLGLKLMTRTPSGMELTPAGRKLLSDAENILLAIDSFKSTAKALHGTLTGQLRLGLIMIDPHFLKLPDLISNMTEHYKDVVVNLEVGGVEHCINGVEQGRLDGAFFAGDIPHRRIKALQLTKIKYRVIAPASWASRLKNSIWGNLALMPWIRAPKPSAHYKMLSDVFRYASIEPVKIIEVDHESVVMSLVRAGIGLSFIREDLAYAAAAQGDVIVWEQATPQFVPLSFVYHVDRQQDPLILALIESLKRLWQSAVCTMPGDKQTLGH